MGNLLSLNFDFSFNHQPSYSVVNALVFTFAILFVICFIYRVTNRRCNSREARKAHKWVQPASLLVIFLLLTLITCGETLKIRPKASGNNKGRAGRLNSFLTNKVGPSAAIVASNIATYCGLEFLANYLSENPDTPLIISILAIPFFLCIGGLTCAIGFYCHITKAKNPTLALAPSLP